MDNNTVKILGFKPIYIYKGEVSRTKYSAKFKNLIKNIASVVYSDMSDGNAWIVSHNMKYEDFHYNSEFNHTYITLNIDFEVETVIEENLNEYYQDLYEFIDRWLRDFNPEDKPYNMNDKKIATTPKKPTKKVNE